MLAHLSPPPFYVVQGRKPSSCAEVPAPAVNALSPGSSCPWTLLLSLVSSPCALFSLLVPTPGFLQTVSPQHFRVQGKV